MARYFRIFEHKVDISDLKPETQFDIANYMVDHFPIFKNHNMYEEAVKNFIFDTVGLKAELGTENPEFLFKQFKNNRSISRLAVDKYKTMIMNGIEFDPVLVSNHNFLDGGHRVVAYMEMKKDEIPTVDISEILNYDWTTELEE